MNQHYRRHCLQIVSLSLRGCCFSVTAALAFLKLTQCQPIQHTATESFFRNSLPNAVVECFIGILGATTMALLQQPIVDYNFPYHRLPYHHHFYVANECSNNYLNTTINFYTSELVKNKHNYCFVYLKKIRFFPQASYLTKLEHHLPGSSRNVQSDN